MRSKLVFAIVLAPSLALAAGDDKDATYLWLEKLEKEPGLPEPADPTLVLLRAVEILERLGTAESQRLEPVHC